MAAKFFSAVCIVLLLTACNSQQPVEDGNMTLADASTLDRTLSGFVEDGRLVGASALVYIDNREVYFGAFGKADRESGRPMKRNTIAQIYSMTKPIVGVALMTLYEQGKFDLNDPIAKYVPELADLKVYNGTDEHGDMILESPARQPIVLDFMRHTPGFGNEDSPGPLGELWKQNDPRLRTDTFPELAAKMGKIPLQYEPGTVWRYGPSVEIQGLMIERLSGKSLAEFLRENIFTPLGMHDTSYFVEPDKRDRFAEMYELDEDGNIEIASGRHAADNAFRHWARTPGSFGLTSTLDDYMRFARMLLNGGSFDGVRILKPETIALMATDFLGDAVTDRDWLIAGKGRVGFGLDFAVRVEAAQSDEEMYGTVGEFFWDGLATTIFWVDPVNRLTVVFFTQLIPHQNAVHKEVRDAVYGR